MAQLPFRPQSQRGLKPGAANQMSVSFVTWINPTPRAQIEWIWHMSRGTLESSNTTPIWPDIYTEHNTDIGFRFDISETVPHIQISHS